MARKYPDKDLKILYGKAQARCSFSNCRKNLIKEANEKDKEAQVGKIAHIRAHSEGGPRYDDNYPEDKIDTYENWILCCGFCHDSIDVQANSYTVEQLLKIKEDHESWVASKMEEVLPEVTFVELEQVCKYIQKSNPGVSNFSKTEITQKINKNNLSDRVSDYIRQGLQKAEEVGKYVSHQAQISPDFPDSLMIKFKQKYNDLAANEKSSDAVFYELLEFSHQGSKDFLRQAGGLSVLAYLFERCEVFEQ